MSDRPFYITTPIYYVNDRPHIGHVYTSTIADVTARARRLSGQEAFLLSGTDEHATKVVEAAAERDLTPLAWADRNAAEFQRSFKELGIRTDDFVRTSEDRHKERVTRYVSQLMESGDVYLGEYEGWYDAGQEEYVPENKARDSEYLSPINGKPLIRKKEKNYFFRLSRYQAALEKHIEETPGFVVPETRRNEILGRIKEGLNDIPMSRTGGDSWGIPVPGDSEHVIYVWIDALFSYLSTVDTEDRRRWWPAEVHLIGKEILWFHAAIWPAMLMALGATEGNEWIQLPKQIRAHSFWIREGRKMSKSLGNFIDLETIDDYVARFGLDAFRFYLTSMGPLGTSDRDFAEDRFIEVYNKELANSVGNCHSRTTSMIAKYCDGTLPERSAPVDGAAELEAQVATCVEEWRKAMDALQVGDACSAALRIFAAIDSFIDKSEPFRKAKDPALAGQVDTILGSCAESIRIASLLLWPVMPERMETLWTSYELPYAATLEDGGLGDLDSWSRWGAVPTGTPVKKVKPLFNRYQPSQGA